MHMPPLLHWRWCRLQRDHSSQAQFLIVKRSAVYEILSKRWSLCWAKVNWSCHCCSLLVQKCLAYIFWVGKCWHERPILHICQAEHLQWDAMGCSPPSNSHHQESADPSLRGSAPRKLLRMLLLFCFFASAPQARILLLFCFFASALQWLGFVWWLAGFQVFRCTKVKLMLLKAILFLSF